MPRGVYERTEHHLAIIRKATANNGSPKGRKFSDEAKKNMSKAAMGKVQSQETKDKRAKSLIGNKNGFGWRPNAEQKEKWYKSHRCATKLNKIEKIVAKELDKIGIVYKQQHKLVGIKQMYVLDIFVPSMMLIIECNGDYWHNLESRMIRDDELQDFVLEHTKYDLLFLWEHVIKSKHFCLQELLMDAGYLQRLEE